MPESRQFCTLHLAGHLFGVPVERVQEVISAQTMTPVPLSHVVIGGLIDLRTRLEFDPRTDGDEPMNVVVQTPSGVVSLLVDGIGDVVDVQDTIFEAPPETLTGVAKELILGVYKFDEQLLLELDIDAAVELATATA